MRATGSLAVATLFLALAGCGGTEDAVLKEAALTAIPLNGAARVADMTDFKADTVCVLYPYHDTVPPEEPQSERINEVLSRDRYRADEMRWAVALAGRDDVRTATFKRSSALDVMVMHQVDPGMRALLPAGFEPAICAAGEAAAFARISWRDRTYVIFGALK